MRQAIHIFRKDTRHFYREIALVWGLAAIFSWHGMEWAGYLLFATGMFLVGRLIHDEPIPGDRQFWITRPYRWRSLLAAKLGFILLVVNAPIGLAQLAIVAQDGFPMAAQLPGLLWLQGLLMLWVWLPVAAVAAMTASGTPFIFANLALLAVGLVGTPFSLLAAVWPSGLEWIRDTVAAFAVAITAAAVLYWQYQNRSTRRHRLLAAAGLMVGLGAYWYLPWPGVFALHSRIAGSAESSAAVQVAFASSLPLTAVPAGKQEVLRIPLLVSGVPAGAEARLDAAVITVDSPGAGRWQASSFSVHSSSTKGGAVQFDGLFPMKSGFAGAVRGQPLTLHASVYLALFGRAREATAAMGEHPVTVMDGLRCYRDRFGVVYCSAAFRWPRELVYTRVTEGTLNPVNSLISYSPFPAGLSLNPVETHWASGPPLSQTQVSVVVKEPLAYVRRELDARQILVKGPGDVDWGRFSLTRQ